MGAGGMPQQSSRGVSPGACDAGHLQNQPVSVWGREVRDSHGWAGLEAGWRRNFAGSLRPGSGSETVGGSCTATDFPTRFPESDWKVDVRMLFLHSLASVRLGGR